MIFLPLKNKYDLTLCQSRLHTASETFVRQKKIGSGSIFCVFASVACILIGKDEEYEKKMEKRMRKFQTQCAMTLSLCFLTLHFSFLCSIYVSRLSLNEFILIFLSRLKTQYVFI